MGTTGMLKHDISHPTQINWFLIWQFLLWGKCLFVPVQYHSSPLPARTDLLFSPQPAANVEVEQRALSWQEREENKTAFTGCLFLLVSLFSWDNGCLHTFKKGKAKEETIKVITVKEDTLFIAHLLPVQFQRRASSSSPAYKSLKACMVWHRHFFYIKRPLAASHGSGTGMFLSDGDRWWPDARAAPCHPGVWVWGAKPAHAWKSQRKPDAQRMEWCSDQMHCSGPAQDQAGHISSRHGPFAWLPRPAVVLSPSS